MAGTHSAGFALFSWRLSVYEMWRAQDIGPPNVVVWTPVTRKVPKCIYKAFMVYGLLFLLQGSASVMAIA